MSSLTPFLFQQTLPLQVNPSLSTYSIPDQFQLASNESASFDASADAAFNVIPGNSQLSAQGEVSLSSDLKPSLTTNPASCAVPVMLSQSRADAVPCKDSEVIQNPASAAATGATPGALASQIAGLPQAANHLPSALQKADPALLGHNEASQARPGFAQDTSQTILPGHDPLAAAYGTSDASTSQLVPPSEAAATDLRGAVTATGQSGLTDRSKSLGATSSSTTLPNLADAGKNADGLKMRAIPGATQTRTKEGFLDASTSGSQSLGSGPMPGAASSQVQFSPADHTTAAIAHGVDTAPAFNAQAVPASVGDSGHGAKMPETASPAPSVAPEAPPVINTARLIQTMSQSEMRVGMRSNEFGNISITTSSVRDVVSAQISLEHGELAKAIAIHLPEMQARLGGHQAMDVTINMNGQGAGTSEGTTNGSADQSRYAGQQTGSTASTGSRTSIAARPILAAVSARTTIDGRLDARLDIQV